MKMANDVRVKTKKKLSIINKCNNLAEEYKN